MITYQIKAGTIDVSVVIRIVDSTDGTPELGVVFNSAGIDIQYRREGAASTAITEATLAALTTAHTDGGFLHIGNGYYRLDLPDAACATGVAGVLVHGIVTGMVVIGCYIQLIVNTAEDVYTRVGAPAGASVSADVAAVKVDTAAILVDTGTTLDARIPAALVGGRMDASVGAMAANVVTATAIAADAITDAKVAADVTIASVTGAVGSVTGAVGSVAAGGIAATSFAAGAIDAAAIANGAIDAATFAAGAIDAAAIANGAIDAATFAAGAIDAGAIAADAITAAKIATGAIDADALATDAVTEIADGILDRNMATGTDSGSPTVRTPRQALRALRNRVAIAVGTATVYKEDDTAASWTAAVTTTAGNPISEVDPASV